MGCANHPTNKELDKIEEKLMAFKTKEKSDGSGKWDILFSPGGVNQDPHGHVVQSTGPNGQTHYHYVRDVEGNIYIDDRH
jgi:hypothetical protein